MLGHRCDAGRAEQRAVFFPGHAWPPQRFLESQSAGLENSASVKGSKVSDGSDACHDATFPERIGGGRGGLQVTEDGIATSTGKEAIHAISGTYCLPGFI
jgi:hypothetical protein